MSIRLRRVPLVTKVGHAELSRWLLVKGYAEERRGYGHVSADDLAEHLLERFDIYNAGEEEHEHHS